MRRLALLAVLAACAPVRPETPPASVGLSLVPAAGGLDVAGSGQEIGFGRHRPGAVAAVARVLGRAPQAPVGRIDCPGGPLTVVAWPREGLTLTFAQGAFVGWQAGLGSAFPGPVRSAGRTC
jgi:hypothetical protein